jgi:multiple sugar transport system ATP-binding protein
VLLPTGTPAGGAFAAVLEGRVFVTEHLGGETYLYLKLADQSTVVMRAEGNHPAQIGETLHLGVPATACHLFEENGLTLTKAA